MDRDLFQELAEAGVFSLRLADEQDGLGLGMTHAAVVFEELGRALVPGPVIETHLAAGLVAGAATGDAVVGAALPVAGGRTLVPHLDGLDAIVLPTDDGLWSLDPAATEATAATRPLDPITPVSLIAGRPSGERIADADAAHRWRLEAATLRAAFLLGIALQTTAAATAYAKEREQFGRPIGGFQAVKHLCADMLTRAEVARAAVYAAAVHLDDPSLGGTDRAVSTAALLAGQAAENNGKSNIQVHGGMGFTWEVDAHLYLKRAMVLASAEPADDHADAVAATL